MAGFYYVEVKGRVVIGSSTVSNSGVVGLVYINKYITFKDEDEGSFKGTLDYYTCFFNTKGGEGFWGTDLTTIYYFIVIY